MKMKNITIIGSGALGSAFANVLFDANPKNNILIYGIDEKELQDIEKGRNTKYFNDIVFNKFKTSNDLNFSLKAADYIVLALPSIAIDSVIKSIEQNIEKEVLIINGCKGFYPNTELPLHEGILDKIKSNKKIRGLVSISGPSFAIEIIKKSLTSVVAIGYDKNQIAEVQKLFNNSYFKLYIQSDVIGSEVGGIYKNILAIGSGILNQLGYKINTLASYLTRGVKEMTIFNKFMGGKEKTIYGLAGLGDLILTATDINSRNFQFGINFIKKEIDKNATVEGLTALKIVEKIRIENNLNLPICSTLYNIIYKNSDAEEEIKKLWNNDEDEE
ncbi:MAG: NAD(P)H-dependent glycerol-3-phosphate dehydrogenase [Mycoplasmataceae bacterium]|nr:NAD(P)H-dependent glycerol-3-phosphate dehydrogenase [Mycoplasmataceae bacterium]